MYSTPRSFNHDHSNSLSSTPPAGSSFSGSDVGGDRGSVSRKGLKSIAHQLMSTPMKASKNSEDLTLTGIVYAYMRSLLTCDHNDPDYNKMVGSLQCFLSKERHDDHKQELHKILDPTIIYYTREDEFLLLKVEMIQYSIHEQILKDHDIDTEKLWDNFRRSLITAAHDEKKLEVEFFVRDKADEYIKNMMTLNSWSQEVIKAFRCWLDVKSELDRLVDNLSNATLTNVTYDADDDLGGSEQSVLLDEAERRRSDTIQKNLNAAESPSIKALIDRRVRWFKAQREIISGDDASDGASLEMTKDVHLFLALHISDLNDLHDRLNRMTLEQKKCFLEEELSKRNSTVNERAKTQEPIEAVDRIRNRIEPIVAENVTSRDRIADMVGSPIQCVSANEREENLLSLAIRSKNQTVIGYVLEYAKYTTQHVVLIEQTVRYFLLNKNYSSLFYLHKDCLFDDTIKVTLCSCLQEYQMIDDQGHFILRTEYIASADCQLLRAIFENYTTYSDDAKFNNIFEKMLNRAIELDNPELIQKILNKVVNRREKAQLLKAVGENTLAYFIRHNNDDDTVAIRDEITRRYIDAGNPLSAPVKGALQEKWAFKERSDRLAKFFKEATQHVCEEYRKKNSVDDKKVYREKLNAIAALINIKETTQPQFELSAEALVIAEELTRNDKVKERTGFFTGFSQYNKTQKFIKEAKQSLLYSSQHKKNILDKPVAMLSSTLTPASLEKIPISKKEQEECNKRILLARAAFKETLAYLRSRWYGQNKFYEFKRLVNQYINNVNQDRQPGYSHDDLIRDLKNSQVLNGKAHFWSHVSTTQQLLNKEVEALIIAAPAA